MYGAKSSILISNFCDFTSDGESLKKHRIVSFTCSTQQNNVLLTISIESRPLTIHTCSYRIPKHARVAINIMLAIGIAEWQNNCMWLQLLDPGKGRLNFLTIDSVPHSALMDKLQHLILGGFTGS